MKWIPHVRRASEWRALALLITLIVSLMFHENMGEATLFAIVLNCALFVGNVIWLRYRIA